MRLTAAIVPMVLQSMDLLPVGFSITGSTLLIEHRVSSASPTVSLAVLVVTTLVTVLAPMGFAYQTARQLRETRQRLLLHVWHLRQLTAPVGDGQRQQGGAVARWRIGGAPAARFGQVPGAGPRTVSGSDSDSEAGPGSCSCLVSGAAKARGLVHLPTGFGADSRHSVHMPVDATTAVRLPRIETARLLLDGPRPQDFEGYASIATGARGRFIGGPLTREQGWLLTASAEGRGLAFEAGAGMRDWAFTHTPLRALASYIDPDNVRALSLAERLGERRVDGPARVVTYRYLAPADSAR
jgi:hypothetical protein